MSHWNRKLEKEKSSQITLSTSNPEEGKIHTFIIPFRENSRKFVVDILTKNFALNFSGALFFIGLGCSLKWWYKDHIFKTLLKQNLPTFSEPQQNLSWETGESLIQERIRSLLEKNRNITTTIGQLDQSFISQSQKGDYLLANIPEGSVSPNYTIKNKNGAGMAMSLQNREEIESWGKEANLSSALQPFNGITSQDPLYVSQEAPSHDKFIETHVPAFHHLIERIDVYANHVNIKFKSPWQKKAHQKFVGLFFQPTQIKGLNNKALFSTVTPCQHTQRVSKPERSATLVPPEKTIKTEASREQKNQTNPFYFSSFFHPKIKGTKIDTNDQSKISIYTTWEQLFPETYFKLSARRLCILDKQLTPYDLQSLDLFQCGNSRIAACLKEPVMHSFKFPNEKRVSKIFPFILNKKRPVQPESKSIHNKNCSFDTPTAILKTRLTKLRWNLENSKLQVPLTIKDGMDTFQSSLIEKKGFIKKSNRKLIKKKDTINIGGKYAKILPQSGLIEKVSYPLESTKTMAGWQPPIITLILNSYLDEIPHKLESVLSPQNYLADIMVEKEQSETLVKKLQLREIKQLLKNEFQILINTLPLTIVQHSQIFPKLSDSFGNTQPRFLAIPEGSATVADHTISDDKGMQEKEVSNFGTLLDNDDVNSSGRLLTANLPNLKTSAKSIHSADKIFDKSNDIASQTFNSSLHTQGVSKGEANPINMKEDYSLASSLHTQRAYEVGKGTVKNWDLESITQKEYGAYEVEETQARGNVDNSLFLLRSLGFTFNNLSPLSNPPLVLPFNDNASFWAWKPLFSAHPNLLSPSISSIWPTDSLHTQRVSKASDTKKGLTDPLGMQEVKGISSPSFLYNFWVNAFGSLPLRNMDKNSESSKDQSEKNPLKFIQFTNEIDKSETKHELATQLNTLKKPEFVFQMERPNLKGDVTNTLICCSKLTNLTWKFCQYPNYEQQVLSFMTKNKKDKTVASTMQNWSVKKLHKKISLSIQKQDPQFFTVPLRSKEEAKEQPNLVSHLDGSKAKGLGVYNNIILKQEKTSGGTIDRINTVDKNLEFANKKMRFMSGYVYPDTQSELLKTTLSQWLSQSRPNPKNFLLLQPQSFLGVSRLVEDACLYGIKMTITPTTFLSRLFSLDYRAFSLLQNGQHQRGTDLSFDWLTPQVCNKEGNSNSVIKNSQLGYNKVEDSQILEKLTLAYPDPSGTEGMGQQQSKDSTFQSLGSSQKLIDQQDHFNRFKHKDIKAGEKEILQQTQRAYEVGKPFPLQKFNHHLASFPGFTRPQHFFVTLQQIAQGNDDIANRISTIINASSSSFASNHFAYPNSISPYPNSVSPSGTEGMGKHENTDLPGYSRNLINNSEKRNSHNETFPINTHENMVDVVSPSRTPVTKLLNEMDNSDPYPSGMGKDLDTKFVTKSLGFKKALHNFPARKTAYSGIVVHRNKLTKDFQPQHTPIDSMQSKGTAWQSKKEGMVSKPVVLEGSGSGSSASSHHHSYPETTQSLNSIEKSVNRIYQSLFSIDTPSNNELTHTCGSQGVMETPVNRIEKEKSLVSNPDVNTLFFGYPNGKPGKGKELSDFSVPFAPLTNSVSPSGKGTEGMGFAYPSGMQEVKGMQKNEKLRERSLKENTLWGIRVLGPENPLTNRQCHFFGQKQLSPLDTSKFQRDYLRELGREITTQANSKSFPEKLPSIERAKILSFSKSVDSFFVKKRKYTYLLEKIDQWYLLFQEQLRATLEDTRPYEGKLTPEEGQNPDKLKISAPLIMVRFPKKMGKKPIKAHNLYLTPAQEYNISTLQHGLSWRPFSYLQFSDLVKRQSHLVNRAPLFLTQTDIGMTVPSLSPSISIPTSSFGTAWRSKKDGKVLDGLTHHTIFDGKGMLIPSSMVNVKDTEYAGSNGYNVSKETVSQSKWFESRFNLLINSHYPLFAERPSLEVTHSPKIQNDSFLTQNLQWFIQEPLTANSWTVISQWCFLIALLVWIEQVFVEDVFPALFALEQLLLGATGLKITGRTDVIRISKKDTPKFQDLAGIDGLLGELSELVLFLRRQQGVGGRFWSKKSSYGVLLTGSPGTGKTFLVRALANEAQVPVLILSAGTLIANKQNSNKPSWSIRHAFRRAKQLAPCILFIDEIDALGKSRGKILTDIDEIVTDSATSDLNAPSATTDHANNYQMEQNIGSHLLSPVSSSYEQFLQNWPSASKCFINEWEYPLKALLVRESNKINRGSLCEEKLFDLFHMEGFHPLLPSDENSFNLPESKDRRTSSPAITQSEETYIEDGGHGLSQGKVNQPPGNRDVNTGVRKFGPLTQLLVSMDGVNSLSGILLIGATNRPELLDPALTRPGRFERMIRIEKPSEQKRIEILRLYSKNLGVQTNIPWSYLANRTFGLTAADLAVAMNYSSLKAIIQGSRHTVDTIEYGLNSITRFSKGSFHKMKRTAFAYPLLRHPYLRYPKGKGMQPTLTNLNIPAVAEGSVSPDLTNSVSPSSTEGMGDEVKGMQKRWYGKDQLMANVLNKPTKEQDSTAKFSRFQKRDRSVENQTDLQSNRYYKRLVQMAYYQAGKIVVQTLLPQHPPVSVIMINLLGITQSTSADIYIPIESTFNIHYCSYLESRLIGLYGGKAASLLFQHQFEIYKSNQFKIAFAGTGKNLFQSNIGTIEIQTATRLATTMVNNWNFYAFTFKVKRTTSLSSKLHANVCYTPELQVLPILSRKSKIKESSVENFPGKITKSRSTFTLFGTTKFSYSDARFSIEDEGYTKKISQTNTTQLINPLQFSHTQRDRFYPGWFRLYLPDVDPTKFLNTLANFYFSLGSQTQIRPSLLKLTPLHTPSSKAWRSKKDGMVNNQPHLAPTYFVQFPEEKRLISQLGHPPTNIHTIFDGKVTEGSVSIFEVQDKQESMPFCENMFFCWGNNNLSIGVGLLRSAAKRRKNLNIKSQYLPGQHTQRISKPIPKGSGYPKKMVLKQNEIKEKEGYKVVSNIHTIFNGKVAEGSVSSNLSILLWGFSKPWYINRLINIGFRQNAPFIIPSQNLSHVQKDLNSASHINISAKEKIVVNTQKNVFPKIARSLQSKNRAQKMRSKTKNVYPDPSGMGQQHNVPLSLLLEEQIFPIGFNNVLTAEKDLIWNSLVNNCFAKAVFLVNQNRQLIDYFADYLIRFQIVRQHQISYIFSTVLLSCTKRTKI